MNRVNLLLIGERPYHRRAIAPVFVHETIRGAVEGLLTSPVRPVPSGLELSDRVLGRLAAEELQEPLVSFRDDIRIAWLCVLFAARENPNPWGFAFWWYLGKTYEKLLPVFLERQIRDQEQCKEALHASQDSRRILATRRSDPPDRSVVRLPQPGPMDVTDITTGGVSPSPDPRERHLGLASLPTLYRDALEIVNGKKAA